MRVMVRCRASVTLLLAVIRESSLIPVSGETKAEAKSNLRDLFTEVLLLVYGSRPEQLLAVRRSTRVDGSL